MQNRTHRLGFILGAAVLGAGVESSALAQDDVVNLWQARFSSMKGDTSCT